MFKKIAALLAISLLLLPGGTFAQGRPVAVVNVIRCDKGDSIQEAVDKAADGSVIEINGHCVENILTKGRSRITFRNNGDASITAASNTSPVLYFIGSTGMVITGLELNGQVYVGEHSKADIRYSILNGVNPNQSALHVTNSSYCGLFRNEINGFVTAVYASSISMNENIVTGGMALWLGGSANVRNNEFHNGQYYGLTVDSNASVFFPAANLFQNNQVGISCGDSGAIRIVAPQTFVGNVVDTVLTPDCAVAGIPFP